MFMAPKNRQLTKTKYLSDAEYEHLHRRMMSLLPIEPRNAALILTAMYTGARASEVLDIRASDLDAKEQTVYIRGLKGSNDREIPLPPWLFEALLALPAADDGRLFAITYPRLDQIWTSLRTCRKKFHALRHTFAIRHYNRTRDLRLIQVALGHRQIANTMIYAAYVYSSEEMRKLLVPNGA